MALSRNFRTTYYKTLGVPVVQHIVDVEASFAALLAEPVVNRAQVVKLAQEIGIPAHYRDLVWQLLSGVLPPQTSIWEFAIQERTVMYQDVVDAAQVLQSSIASDARIENGDPACYENAADIHVDVADRDVDVSDASKPTSQSSSSSSSSNVNAKTASKQALSRLIRLHRTYWCEIMVRKPLRGMDDELYLEGVMCMVCKVVAGEMERFWCFTKLLELFHDGMGQYKPTVSLQNFHDVSSVSDFEMLFIRILEALK